MRPASQREVERDLVRVGGRNTEMMTRVMYSTRRQVMEQMDQVRMEERTSQLQMAFHATGEAFLHSKTQFHYLMGASRWT